MNTEPQQTAVAIVGAGMSGLIAAYYDRKNAVRRISKGSTVFLYHTGVGVIAKGKAPGGVQITDYSGDAVLRTQPYSPVANAASAV